ncbi:NAD(P)-dependent oxidoreductase [Mycolicibacterium litorale]|uniref:NAD(P)-dependent oxidoreductase n=1 Tax=Mycolicibacterium litorale TaxID=758802 RepID=UPI003CFB45C4
MSDLHWGACRATAPDREIVMTRVQFIGLGAMGTPMVKQLAERGISLFLSDIDGRRARALALEINADYVADAGTSSRVDFVILMLPNSEIVETVLGSTDDPGSLLGSLRPGATIIDMGSSSPESSRQIAQRAAQSGIEFIDAPVSGGVARAAVGELTIMVGSRDQQSFERVLPILSVMGSAVTRVGSVGAGHALKALNNLLSVIGLIGGLEVIAVGQKFGVDPTIMLDVINRSTGRNHATEVKIGPEVLQRRWGVGFSLALTVKDVTTAQNLGRSAQMQTPLSDAAVRIATDALDYLAGTSPDQSQIAEYIEAVNKIMFHP